MSKIFKIITLSITMFLFVVITANAESEITFNQLVENAKLYNGKTITVRGEAIGESMKRGTYSWVNISDGTLPMGIWMDSNDAAQISVYGNYHNTGDLVEVTGTFNRACSEHGGDMDIHAQSVKIVKKGTPTPHPVNKRRIIVSIVSTICIVILLRITYKSLKLQK